MKKNAGSITGIIGNMLTVHFEGTITQNEVAFAIHGDQRLGDVMRNFSDTSKARKGLGWSADMTLLKGLENTVRSFVNLEE